MQITTTEILPIYKETLYVHKLESDLLKPIGEFTKRILLFVSEKDNNPESEILLANMLTACGVQGNDCYKYTINQSEQTLQLINTYDPKYVLSFGVYIANEVYKMRPDINVVQHIYNAKAIIAMPLHTMIADAKAKASLWSGLQKMFDIQLK
jgi:hypothetical protein